MSCKLISESMNLVCCAVELTYARLTVGQVIVNEETSHETHDFISKRLTAIKSQRSTGELEDLALIIGANILWLRRRSNL